jgi:hypothetical protein
MKKPKVLEDLSVTVDDNNGFNEILIHPGTYLPLTYLLTSCLKKRNKESQAYCT